MTKNLRQNLHEFTQDKEILDIERIGFVYLEDKPLRFYSDLTYICVKVGIPDSKCQKYIEIEHAAADVGDEGVKFVFALIVRLTDDIKFTDDDDTDIVSCTSSIEREVLLFPEGKNVIDDIIFHGLKEIEDGIVCGALEIISGENIIFFDPITFDGTLVGGMAKKLDWQENFKFHNDGKLPHATSLYEKNHSEEL